MNGIIYVVCTNVGRAIIKSHLRYFKNIPISGIVNLDFKKSLHKANYDNLHDIAINNNIPIHYCSNINSNETIDFILNKSPKLIIQSGWSQKFKKIVLDIPKYGCIGEHPSPLPEGRGAACVNWAIIKGKRIWGDSFFKMVEKYDAGDLYAQEKIQISINDTCKTVYDKIALTSYKIVKDNLEDWFNGKFNIIDIDESRASYYKRRKPQDGNISFSWDLNKIIAYVNALTKPYPGAFFFNNDDLIIIWKAESTSLTCNKKPGTIVSIDDQSMHIVTGDKRIIKLMILESEFIPEVNGCQFYNMYFKNINKEIIIND